VRENISTIFAILIGVVVLIVFPLFSIMTRQDSISYNKVLTLTTEFVDSVRTKGYFTEQEYTDYLVKLSNTKNTYNVQLEYHKKILINDINNESMEPAFVEDTLVYYNNDITRLLESGGKVTFRENDEFYIKIYNTNITTASLLYNYFARVSVPPKVINIGYGGKVSYISGATYSKTDFSTAYTPYIKFGEIVNLVGKNNEECFNRELGEYSLETCIRLFDIEDANNRTIKVPFQMYNFENIINYTAAGNREIKQITNSEQFDDNKSYIIDAIQNLISLRGIENNELEDDDKYIVEVVEDQLVYNNGVITGQIQISNINLPDGVENEVSRVIIGQGLLTGTTGIVSAEATTHEIIFSRTILYPEFQLLGPFKTQELQTEAEIQFEPKEVSYFKVKMIDYESEIVEYNLIDLDTGEIIDKSQYTLNILEEITNKEYWFKLTYSSFYEKTMALSITTKKPIDDADESIEGENVVQNVAVNSNAFTYNSWDWSKVELDIKKDSQVNYNRTGAIGKTFGFSGRIYITFPYNYKKDTPFDKNSSEFYKFVLDVINLYSIGIEYEDEDNPGYNLNYTLDIEKPDDFTTYSQNNKYYILIDYNWVMRLCSQTEQINKKDVRVQVYINRQGNKDSRFNMTIFLLGLDIPEGFRYVQEGNNVYIEDIVTNERFVWVARESIPNTFEDSDKPIEKNIAYRDEYYNALVDSVARNGGFYLAVNSTPVNYTECSDTNCYWQQAWDDSVSKYADHPDIVSHMAYYVQMDGEEDRLNLNKEEYSWIANYVSVPSGTSYFFYAYKRTEYTSSQSPGFDQHGYRLALFLK